MCSTGCFLLIALISSASAIRCYIGSTKNSEKPIETMDCPMSKYCTKRIMQVRKDKMNTYWCDFNTCAKDGCVKGLNDVVDCCCSKDLCNTSTRAYTILALVLVVMQKLLL